MVPPLKAAGIAKLSVLLTKRPIPKMVLVMTATRSMFHLTLMTAASRHRHPQLSRSQSHSQSGT